MDDGVTPKFLEAIEFVLLHEGGYVNNPRDPGGETNLGISKRSYPLEDIQNMTRARAIEIYHRDWWKRYGYDRIESTEVAKKVFDLAVNMGQTAAVKCLQLALDAWIDPRIHTPIEIDGGMGPRTVDACNALVQRHGFPPIYRAICHYAADHYQSLAERDVFLRGWLRRAFA